MGKIGRFFIENEVRSYDPYSDESRSQKYYGRWKFTPQLGRRFLGRRVLKKAPAERKKGLRLD